MAQPWLAAKASRALPHDGHSTTTRRAGSVCAPCRVIAQSCTDVHSFALPCLARKQIPARATPIVRTGPNRLGGCYRRATRRPRGWLTYSSTIRIVARSRRAVSSAVEHCLHTAGVTSSILVPPTTSSGNTSSYEKARFPRIGLFLCFAPHMCSVEVPQSTHVHFSPPMHCSGSVPPRSDAPSPPPCSKVFYLSPESVMAMA